MRLLTRCAVLVLLIGPTWSLCAQEPVPVSAETFAKLMAELSNWGRWGEDDQLGTLNLITQQKRVQAARLVENGVSISLARNLETRQSPDSTYHPIEHTMHFTGIEPGWGMYSEDSFTLRYHGLGHTHLDALCHAFHEGRMYNGYEQTKVTKDGGQVLSIVNAAKGIFTRGVLIDIPWLKDVPYLEPATAIYPEDLDAWAAKTGIQIQAGDVIVVRTGRWARPDDEGLWDTYDSLAGLHASSIRWVRNRDVAAVGSDAGSDVLPWGVEGQFAPVHKLLLVAMGTPIFDNLDLEALSREAKRQGRWDFLFTVAPLRIAGGTGSPLNPIAIF